MFSKLDNDEKTFYYILRYLKECHDSNEAFCIDNDLQIEEIKTHLFLNQTDFKNIQEQLDWVKSYSKNFREYINSMKIVWASWILNGNKPEDFNYETFLLYQEKWNSIRGIMEGIHN